MSSREDMHPEGIVLSGTDLMPVTQIKSTIKLKFDEFLRPHNVKIFHKIKKITLKKLQGIILQLPSSCR